MACPPNGAAIESEIFGHILPYISIPMTSIYQYAACCSGEWSPSANMDNSSSGKFVLIQIETYNLVRMWDETQKRASRKMRNGGMENKNRMRERE